MKTGTTMMEFYNYSMNVISINIFVLTFTPMRSYAGNNILKENVSYIFYSDTNKLIKLSGCDDIYLNRNVTPDSLNKKLQSEILSQKSYHSDTK